MTSLARTPASLLSLFIITCLNCFALPRVGAAQEERDAALAPATQTDIAGPPGSGSFGSQVTVLPNGNIVVTDPTFDNGTATDTGAVYLYDGATLGIISTLKGKAGDFVGSGGVTVLTNGNYVVKSPNWRRVAVTDAGAVTWCSATTGCDGIVSAANSLVGSQVHDGIGGFFIYRLTNGNYVVASPEWDRPSGSIRDAGAVTWGNGKGGTVGIISASNSLVGSSTDDRVGAGGLIALSNGNYLVNSRFWDNPVGPFPNAGAVTFGKGTGGTVGPISPSISLVGGNTDDKVGSGGVTVLTNGNYVVSSPFWDDPVGPVPNAGAATWGSGTTGIRGFITSANSLVGGKVEDFVGGGGVTPLPNVTALTNGNYVVRSPLWDDPAGPVENVGAVTWCDGTTGKVGLITSSNSLVGSAYDDLVGGGGVVLLTNGNYVVNSPFWNNPAGPWAAGAVTWSDGTTGITGLVTSSNSLVGGSNGDNVGIDGVTVLTNGNYVVSSPKWNDPLGPSYDVGAVTWGNGAGGTTGLVKRVNSLVGSTSEDSVSSGGVTALPNGNYVVSSPRWDKPTGMIRDAGAVTWGNGASGTTGFVARRNSLFGGSEGDYVGGTFSYFGGIGGVTVLTNSNYVVSSPNWHGEGGAIFNAGAATWGNGMGGTVGIISASNSLVGSSTDDRVGAGGLIALSNGNYVVNSPGWDKPTGMIANAGAVTFGNGTGGTAGFVARKNSLVGGSTDDQVGIGGVTALRDGNYLVINPAWDNPAGAIMNAEAITLGKGTGGTTGLVSSDNSVLGTATSGISSFSYDTTRNRLFVGRGESNIVSILTMP
jgi:hypothetical protein